MKMKKAELMVRSFWDHSGLEKHFEEMAAEGWMLDSIGALLHYRRSEPAKLRFCITYCAQASFYDPGPTDEEQDLQALSEYMGWTLAAAGGQMQVYYTDREDAVPLQTDPVMEVENIHKTAKKTVFVQDILFLIMGLMWLGMKGWDCVTDTVEALSDPTTLFVLATYLVLAVISGADLGVYLRWRSRALQAASQGEFLPTTDMRPLQLGSLAALTVCLVLYAVSAVSEGSQLIVPLALSILLVFCIVLIITQLRTALKRAGVSRTVNYAVCIALAAVLTIATTMAGVLLGMGSVGRAGYRWGREQGLETYDWHGQTRYVYQDQIPLRVEDLLGDSQYSGYVTEQDSQETFLVSQKTDMQYPRWDDPAGNEVPALEYTVVSVKFAPLLLDACLEDMLQDMRRGADIFRFTVLETDPAPWGADAVWEKVDEDGTSWNEYLIRWGSRIVLLKLDWTPDQSQMAVIAGKLADG